MDDLGMNQLKVPNNGVTAGATTQQPPPQQPHLMNAPVPAPGHIIYTLAPTNQMMAQNAMNPFAMLNAPTIQVPIMAPPPIQQHAPSSSSGKSSQVPKFKKAPDAPKRFKSAFIIFSAEKHKAIKQEFSRQGRSEKTTDIAKLVSEAWREMPPDEKEVWETKARKDKARYEVEKRLYKGPWKIPANKRTPKDPTAPKRPMSAFLAFSNKRRAALKRENPDATNADLSRMLSTTWKEAPEEVRRQYMEEEAGLRAIYKVEMAKWKKKAAEEKRTEREEREAMALQVQAAESRQAEQAQQQVQGMQQVQIPLALPQNQAAGTQDLTNGTVAPNFFNPYAAMAGLAAGAVPGFPFQGIQQQQVQPQQQQQGQPQQQQQQQQAQQQQQGQQGADAQQFANFMGGNPFAPQQFATAAQQQLLSQLFNQQMKYPMQNNALGMYQGFPGQGMSFPGQNGNAGQQFPTQQQQQPQPQQAVSQQPSQQQQQQAMQQQMQQQFQQQFQQQLLQQQMQMQQQAMQQQPAQQQQQPQGQQQQLMEQPGGEQNNGAQNNATAQAFGMSFPQIGEAATDSQQQQQQAMLMQQAQQLLMPQAQQQMFLQPNLMSQQAAFSMPQQQMQPQQNVGQPQEGGSGGDQQQQPKAENGSGLQ